MLEQCNEVNISFYNGGDTLHFHTKDPAGVAILKNLIEENNQSIKNPCPAMGMLTYSANGQPVYTAEFAVSENNKEARCNYVRYLQQPVVYTHQLSDRAHNLLQEIHATSVK